MYLTPKECGVIVGELNDSLISLAKRIELMTTMVSEAHEAGVTELIEIRESALTRLGEEVLTIESVIAKVVKHGSKRATVKK